MSAPPSPLRLLAHRLNNLLTVPYLLLSVPLPDDPEALEVLRQRLLRAVEDLRQVARELAEGGAAP